MIFFIGAASGIGEAITMEFAQQGVSLVLVDVNSEMLDIIVQQCIQIGIDKENVIYDILI